MKFKNIYFLFCLFFNPALSFSESQSSAIQWQSWSPKVFEDAQKENKNVLLYLEAIWCHWCHVIDLETYTDHKVIATLHEGYIPVRVDQDSNPDLSNRYKDYGWPATIVFNSKAQELAKRSGYIPKEKMQALLVGLRKNPTPIADDLIDNGDFTHSELSEDTRQKLIANHYNSIDWAKGGLNISQKYLDADVLDYALLKSFEESERDMKILELTLKSNLWLFDPAWGGVYQYSTAGDWKNPHFEKIISTQAKNMRIYANAFALTADHDYEKAANDVYRFVSDFLKSPEGAFYTSQDSDLVKGQHAKEYFGLNNIERRAKGIPAIDKNIYSRENGLMIEALSNLYASNQDKKVLDAAISAANFIINNRKLSNGGFKHGDQDVDGPYLGDSLYMGIGALGLYSVTGDRHWLREAISAANFIQSKFIIFNGEKPLAGFVSTPENVKAILPAVRILRENIDATRFFNLLSYYSGKASFKEVAKIGMSYLALEKIALKTLSEPGILLADYEITKVPLHVTIVGSKNDLVSQSLFATAFSYPLAYKRVEWWDRAEGSMPNADVTYPALEKPAAYVCTNKQCSLPLTTPETLRSKLDKFLKRKVQ
ncbi:MAG: DUF255 domain-containing protein [bacterium]|nr:DUF255 domain-containing protein [bacterium]